MGNPVFSRKQRGKICEGCPSKCHAYLSRNTPPFSPRKRTKIPPGYRTPSLLYQFCIHYDFTSNRSTQSDRDLSGTIQPAPKKRKEK